MFCVWKNPLTESELIEFKYGYQPSYQGQKNYLKNPTMYYPNNPLENKSTI